MSVTLTFNSNAMYIWKGYSVDDIPRLESEMISLKSISLKTNSFIRQVVLYLVPLVYSDNCQTVMLTKGRKKLVTTNGFLC